MGKSPAKWIKSILLGKKSLKSHGSKGREASKATDQHGKGSAAPDSPVISQPIPVNAARSAMKTEKGPLSSTTANLEVVPPRNQDVVPVASAEKSTTEKIREERAAVKAQAAFRGYLARRAFRALRGIIRLQALIRGHLVRRQAAATLRCIQAIVKLQALARGQKDSKQINTFRSSQKVKFSSNAFVRKFVSSKRVALPLQMHYSQGEPNSAWNWLERWTRSLFWKPLTQPKKAVADYKSQKRNGGYAMETESVKSKRTIRRNVAANSDPSGPTSITIKRNFKKVPSLPAETVQEHPQSELEKVKRNLRKISNSVAQSSSDQVEIEADKPRNSVRRPPALAAEVPEQEAVISAEKMKKNNDAKPEVEIYSKHNYVDLEPSLETDLHIKTKKPCSEIELNMDVVPKHGEVDMTFNTNSDNHEAKLQQPPLTGNGFVKDKNQASLNAEKTSNEEEVCQENQKTSKRRASLSAKPEYQEDGLQKPPNLPSYMAATKSAKAKLSPRRLSSDGIEKYSSTRRYSLPSSTNGKLNSSQTQRPVATNGRVVKSDRGSLGHDKPVQVEWRR